MIREHTDSDWLCVRAVNGEGTHREVNTFQGTGRTIANLWLPLWFQFNYCSTQSWGYAHMHRLPVWSLADSCSDPTLMQPCRGLCNMPGLPHVQTDARWTPPYQQSCCQTTQGDSKWVQRVLVSFLTHTHTTCGLFYLTHTRIHT